MKKLIAMAAVVVAAVCANAATVNWQLTAGQMYDHTGTSTFTGMLEVYASGADLSTDTVVFSASPAAATYNKSAFSTENLTAGNTYTFYIVLTDGDYKFTSATKDAVAAETGASLLNWGSLKTATQTASNWQSSAVPEPTSGLLMLLGVAGLALRRRCA